MNWRMRLTSYAVVICVLLTTLMGLVGLRHAYAVHPGEWWFALLFLVPGIGALLGIYLPGGDDE